MKIGFVGLGHMGATMAQNLLKAGHDLTVFNRSPGHTQALLPLGAHVAHNIADACNAQVVITMLADDAADTAVAFAQDGLLANLPKGAIHLSMSTISVELSRHLAQAHAAAAQCFVSAPVFGRPDAAATGRLFIVAAGDAVSIDTCRPLFDAIGQKTVVIGREPWTANLVKLSGNFLQAAAIEALGEAIALIAKAGIDPRTYVAALTSTVLTAPAYKTYGDLIADTRFAPAAFTAALGYKDIRFTLAAAESLSVPMPVAGLLHDQFLRIFARGGDQLDWSAIGGLAALDADVAHRTVNRPAQPSVE